MGGFRRRFKCEATDGARRRRPPPREFAGQRYGVRREFQPHSGQYAPSVFGPTWKDRLRDQLLQKRAEIIATQQRLESLSLEQQELEMLYTRAHS